MKLEFFTLLIMILY